MNTRKVRPVLMATCVAVLAATGALGCEQPVDIGGGGGGSTGAAVGTTQTTSAELPSSPADTDTSAPSLSPSPPQPQPPQPQPQENSSQHAAVQPQGTAQATAQAQGQAQTATPSSAAPVDSSGYGTLPMPNAETQVGSYSANTVISAGGTGSVVTDVSGAPPQAASGSNANVVSSANAAIAVGALGTANDLPAASPRSSQNVYTNTATQVPATSQLRTAATVATPVQPPRVTR